VTSLSLTSRWTLQQQPHSSKMSLGQLTNLLLRPLLLHLRLLTLAMLPRMRTWRLRVLVASMTGSACRPSKARNPTRMGAAVPIHPRAS